MKTFTITRRNKTKHIVSVDDEDWDQVSKHTWCVYYQNGYLKGVQTNVRENGKQTTLRLHQLIMGPVPPEYDSIDHIDRNTLNNCRANLRFATQRGQNINQGMRSNNISGVKGVCWEKKANKWRAVIDHKHVGYYTSFEKACEVRAEAENERADFCYQ
jgi:hypothetical protein